MSPTRSKQPTTGEAQTSARARLVDLVKDIRSQVPAEISEEEIERDARQTIKDVRRRHRARRR